MATINSFPNNADEFIGAEEVMRWLHGRTSGVFGAGGNAAVTAVANSMAVEVSEGLGWLTDAGGNGIVWWSSASQQLTIDPAHTTLDRIDRIIVEWYVGDYSDKPEIKVLKGTSSSTPSAPALTNTSLYRQISLARVSIPHGTTEITSSLITDERLDPTVCGLVTETVSVDTSMIDSQFEAFLAAIEEELRELQAGVGVDLKKLMFTNTTVAAASFVSDATYTDYPYRAAVALTGVISGMVPEVIFGLDDAISGTFAPIADSYNGGVYIYANSAPASAITIPTIIVWRDNA